MWKLFIIPAFAIIAALWGLPNYGFYQILKIAVTLQSIVSAFMVWDSKSILNQILLCLLIFIAVLFCPLFDIHMSRSHWANLDALAGGLLIWAAMVIAEKHSPEDIKAKETEQQQIERLTSEIKSLFAENKNLRDALDEQKNSLEHYEKEYYKNFREISEIKYLKEDYKKLETSYNNLKLQASRHDNFDNEIKEILSQQKLKNILSADIDKINAAMQEMFLTHKSIVVRYDVISDKFIIEAFKSPTPALYGYDGYFNRTIIVFVTTDSKNLFRKEIIDGNFENYRKKLFSTISSNLKAVIINTLSSNIKPQNFSTEISILEHN